MHLHLNKDTWVSLYYRGPLQSGEAPIRLIKDNNVLIGGGFFFLLLLAAIFAPELAPHDPNEQDLFNVLIPPMWAEGGMAEFPLGTDSLGQCVLSRMIYGAQVVVIIALTAPIGAAIVGCVMHR